MFKLLPKSQYPTEMLCFVNTTHFNHLCTSYKRLQEFLVTVNSSGKKCVFITGLRNEINQL